MTYTIVSGDYKTKIDKQNHHEAAISAIQLWQLKAHKPKLSVITTVTDITKKEIYLSTSNLLEEI